MSSKREDAARTGVLGSAAVVCGSVLATLAALEVFFRIEVGSRLDPRLATRLPLPEAAPCPHGALRILAVGDSFTRGVWLPPEHAYPALLEEDLREHGVAAEVFNLGWPGTNTIDQLELLREVLPRYEPDLVLLGFFANDVDKSRAELAEEREHPAEDREHPAEDRGLGGRLWSLRNDTYLFRFLRPRFFQALHQLGIAPPRSVRYASQIDSEYARGGERFRLCQEALREMDTLCEANGFRLLVLGPAMESFEDGYAFPSYYGAVVSFCRGAGIAVHDLFPAFRGMNPLGLRVSLLDNHPNERAYRILAQAVARRLRDGGWLAAGGNDAPPTVTGSE